MLPLAVDPVKTTWLDCVAGCEMVIVVLPAFAVMVAPARIPVPVIGRPTTRAVFDAVRVSVLLPATMNALEVVTAVAVAGFDRTIVVPVADTTYV